jgi:hypothetical protein
MMAGAKYVSTTTKLTIAPKTAGFLAPTNKRSGTAPMKPTQIIGIVFGSSVSSPEIRRSEIVLKFPSAMTALAMLDKVQRTAKTL